MQKSFPWLITLLIFLSSCQKEIDFTFPLPDNSPNGDSLWSIVADGSTVPAGYDSAVMDHTAGGLVIRHHNQSGNLTATETIRYDNSDRVVSYKTLDEVNSTYTSTQFSYSNANLIPSLIIDTTLDVTDPRTSRSEVGQVMANNNGKKLTIYNSTQHFLYPSFNSIDTVVAWFNGNERLVLYEAPKDDFFSHYYYNASGGDPDSCFATTVSNDDTYSAVAYTATPNPLQQAARFMYRNLLLYAVTDQLNNSIYETVLDVVYLPSEILSSRTPSRSRFGNNRNNISEENTYTWVIQNNRVQNIMVVHQDTFGGAATQTKYRFHYK